MATIVPWLIPPNFLGAMSSGAQAGLQLRGQYLQQQQQAAAEAQAAERLRLANEELFQQARQADMANHLKAEMFAQEQERFQIAQERQQRMEQANALYGSALAQGLQGEKPDILGAFAQAAGAAPGAEAVQKLDADALLRAQNATDQGRLTQGLLTRIGQEGIDFNEPILTNPANRGTPEWDEAIARVAEKKAKVVQARITPAAQKNAKLLVDNLETETGVKLSPTERAHDERVMMEFGNKRPQMDPQTRSRINVSANASALAAQLMDEIEAHPEIKFGPGRFRFDVAKGEWVSDQSEASKINQLFTKLYAGQAFSQGGKQLTKQEIELIQKQIGDPTQSNFVQKLGNAQQFFVQDLGLVTRELQDQGFDEFSSYSKWIDRLSQQHDSLIKKYGIRTSEEFAAPSGKSGTNVPPPNGRETGKVYPTPKGPLKWTGTGWIKP